MAFRRANELHSRADVAGYGLQPFVSSGTALFVGLVVLVKHENLRARWDKAREQLSVCCTACDDRGMVGGLLQAEPLPNGKRVPLAFKDEDPLRAGEVADDERAHLAIAFDPPRPVLGAGMDAYHDAFLVLNRERNLVAIEADYLLLAQP